MRFVSWVKYLLGLIGLLFCVPYWSFATQDSVDGLKLRFDTLSARYNDYHFQSSQMIAPVTLLSVSAFGLVDNSPLRRLSNSIHGEMEKHGYQAKIDNVIQYAPIAFHLALGFTEVKSRYCFRDRAIIATTSYLINLGVTSGLKKLSRELRPYGHVRTSFPSGHTATAFTGAEMVRIEYGNGLGAFAYGIATTVGLLRVYNDRHWFHDVFAGAGVGILSAKAGYWLLPAWRRLFKLKDRGAVTMFVPSFDPQNRSVGLNLCLLY